MRLFIIILFSFRLCTQLARSQKVKTAILISFNNTQYAFGHAIALVRRCAANHFPTIISKLVNLFFDLIDLNTSTLEAFGIINST